MTTAVSMTNDHSAPSRVAMGELTRYDDAPLLTDIAANGQGVFLTWADDSQASLPYLWLRDHCACSECRHATTRERLYIPRADVDAPQDVSLERGHLHVIWADGHESVFDGGWLHQRRPGTRSQDQVPERQPWTNGFSPERIGHAAFVNGPEGECAWLEALLRDGLVMLDGGPIADEEVSRLAERIGPMRPTNFGARFDVRSKPNPNNAAYTAIGLALHTDLPNWRQPPDIQLLYCLENEAEGGESIFADGFAAANALRDQAPEAFRILSETTIDFRFQDDTQDIGIRAPIIELDADGRVVEIRFNNWIRDTLQLPAHEIAPWYAAYQAFWQLVHAPEQQIEFALAPGEMIAFDNRRVLHGRRAFDPNTGRRHLQGTYLDRDMLESRLRVLTRQG
ncbi:TauD/TfdA family dioxygenase [Aidingimonas lacisalsi]|uniref:TauD/TfdA family dioxygenase n=1 Tax=Aidingimonas lacisalsi TaxID=2604086 RepID=UPI001F33E421|nr:TauD/TfdA family dioxygenase [Aidingimonas lacisalsi]